ncbi:YbaB/EbfC family nucleoid-associated protein [Candidatus Acetothermia bacterium]|nr:YbaB/EbfC family nucleoid-associated protein [Candidatus Bipolaricaulota bacterium]RLE37876.1 MAG: YbaB/EbfC family nucleoid-associated protein [Candidatus Acetothermia bacterium]
MKGMGNLGNLMKQAKKLQQELEKAQAEIAEMKVEASSGGGMVTAVVNGKGELLNLSIEREVVDPDDIEMLVDLIVAAVQEAQKTAAERAQERLGPLAQGMNIPGMPGL